MNEDPANIKYNKIQQKASFAKVRDDIFNLLKKFIILHS